MASSPTKSETAPYASENLKRTDNYGQSHHNINPDCPVCHKPVFWSRHILSVDRAWHVQCFKCSYCNKPLKPGEHSLHGGKIFCTDPCYGELFVGHSLPSESRNLPNGPDGSEYPCNWGKDGKADTCMRCMSCERLMVPGDNATHDRFPFCKFPGYEQALAESRTFSLKFPKVNARCVRCLKPVYAAEFCYSMSYPWHIHCLRCSSCDRILQPGSHAVHEGLPYCTFPCYNRIYAIDGFRRGLHECRP